LADRGRPRSAPLKCSSQAGHRSTTLLSSNQEVECMPKYLLSGSYTPQSWAKLVDSPEDRSKAARDACEAVGGKLESFYWAFGADDFFAIADLPNDVAAGGVSVGVSSGGAVTSVKTIKLITMEEGRAMLEKAQQVRKRYVPVGAR
jgi:uncharacterized protein with GYD domain